jgi:hypothetical protein
MSPTTVPITIMPEAAQRVTLLGMQTEFDRMLEYTRQRVPGLRSVEVQLALPYDTGEEPTVVIEATRDDPHLDYDPTDMDWGSWQVNTFSPYICRYFVMMSIYRPDHER